MAGESGRKKEAGMQERVATAGMQERMATAGTWERMATVGTQERMATAGTWERMATAEIERRMMMAGIESKRTHMHTPDENIGRRARRAGTWEVARPQERPRVAPQERPTPQCPAHRAARKRSAWEWRARCRRVRVGARGLARARGEDPSVSIRRLDGRAPAPGRVRESARDGARPQTTVHKLAARHPALTLASGTWVASGLRQEMGIKPEKKPII